MINWRNWLSLTTYMIQRVAPIMITDKILNLVQRCVPQPWHQFGLSTLRSKVSTLRSPTPPPQWHSQSGPCPRPPHWHAKLKNNNEHSGINNNAQYFVAIDILQYWPYLTINWMAPAAMRHVLNFTYIRRIRTGGSYINLLTASKRSTL